MDKSSWQILQVFEPRNCPAELKQTDCAQKLIPNLNNFRLFTLSSSLFCHYFLATSAKLILVLLFDKQDELAQMLPNFDLESLTTSASSYLILANIRLFPCYHHGAHCTKHQLRIAMSWSEHHKVYKVSRSE